MPIDFALYVDELVNESDDDHNHQRQRYPDGQLWCVCPNNINPATLRIHRFDEETESWIDVATECSPVGGAYDRSVAGQLSVPICHFSEYLPQPAQPPRPRQPSICR
ncbi:MAG: hypothetical protein R3E79_58270 [Caldilineaceae bacterium]